MYSMVLLRVAESNVYVALSESTRVSACAESARQSELAASSAGLFAACFRSAPASFPWLSLSWTPKLVDWSMVNTAPTNLVIYVSSVVILLEAVALRRPVSAGK